MSFFFFLLITLKLKSAYKSILALLNMRQTILCFESMLHCVDARANSVKISFPQRLQCFYCGSLDHNVVLL